MKVLKLAAAALCLMGCANTPPSDSEVAAIGYGAPLTIDYQAAVKAWFFHYLKDPISAQYVFQGSPQPLSERTGFVNGHQVIAGYQVTVQVNAKNSYGAYIGFSTYYFLFRNNQIINVSEPSSLGGTVPVGGI
jgi:hypothetical protein